MAAGGAVPVSRQADPWSEVWGERVPASGRRGLPPAGDLPPPGPRGRASIFCARCPGHSSLSCCANPARAPIDYGDDPPLPAPWWRRLADKLRKDVTRCLRR